MTFFLIFLAYGVVLSVALGRAGLPSRPAAAPGTATAAPRRVLVVGSTGGTGRRLVAEALERGLEVTALVRDPSRGRFDDPRVRVLRGDVLDPESLAAAAEGQDAVLCALGHRRYLGPSRILSEGTRNLLRAMEAGGVRRLVCETSLGIGDSAGRMGLLYTFFIIPAVLPFYFWDKTRQERAVAGSGVEWVIVRPGALTHGKARGGLRHGPRVGGFVLTPSVSRADVAAFMLDQLTSDAYRNAAVGVCR